MNALREQLQQAVQACVETVAVQLPQLRQLG